MFEAPSTYFNDEQQSKKQSIVSLESFMLVKLIDVHITTCMLLAFVQLDCKLL